MTDEDFYTGIVELGDLETTLIEVEKSKGAITRVEQRVPAKDFGIPEIAMATDSLEFALSTLLDYVKTDASFARVYALMFNINQAYGGRDYFRSPISGKDFKTFENKTIPEYLKRLGGRADSKEYLLDLGDEVKTNSVFTKTFYDEDVTSQHWRRYVSEREKAFPVGSCGMIIRFHNGRAIVQFPFCRHKWEKSFESYGVLEKDLRTGKHVGAFLQKELELIPPNVLKQGQFREELRKLKKTLHLEPTTINPRRVKVKARVGLSRTYELDENGEPIPRCR